MSRQPEYAIQNLDDPELFWSNVQGWVDAGYDTFTNIEATSVRLPIGGIWVSTSSVEAADCIHCAGPTPSPVVEPRFTAHYRTGDGPLLGLIVYPGENLAQALDRVSRELGCAIRVNW